MSREKFFNPSQGSFHFIDLLKRLENDIKKIFFMNKK